MDRANRIIREILDDLKDVIRPGITTLDIDRYAEERIRAAGAKAAFKGYKHPAGGADFPGSTCTSLNDEIVHGIPSSKVVLKDGDVISVDIGVIIDGYFGDSAHTYAVGTVSPEAQALMETTERALMAGIDQARPGNRISDIGHAVQTAAEDRGYSVVREFVGHGIGSSLHEEPQVPNYGRPGRRERLEVGLVIAIEPMVNLGGPDVLVSADDGWTARTRDGSLSAHYEACVAITENGPWILGRSNENRLDKTEHVQT